MHTLAPQAVQASLKAWHAMVAAGDLSKAAWHRA